MVFKFKMPDIGEGLQEGEIVKWLVAEGDAVTEDQPIVEVMTDKATVELPAPRTGTIKKIIHPEGTVVPVGEVFVEIEEGGAKITTKPAKAEKTAKPAQETEKEEPAAEENAEPKEEKMLFEASSPSAGGTVGQRRSKNAAPATTGNGQTGDKVLAAPAVRRMAREADVDLAQVPGSGPGGRVTRADLESFLEGGATVQVERRPAAQAAAVEPMALPRHEREERVPMKGVRRVIAQAMHRSKTTAAHFTYVEEVDATRLVAFREKAKELGAERDVHVTFIPIFVKAVCAALKAFPLVNSSYDESTQELVYKKHYDIGIAVATEAGLIVPVVRDADRKDMFTIQKEIVDLAERTRQGKAKPDELRGSTFTITSLGKTGGLLATPVINYPEVAIMGVHAIKDKPVIRMENGEAKIVPGKVMNLSFSFDHRIVDGAVGAEFAQRVIRYLEDPELLVLEG